MSENGWSFSNPAIRDWASQMSVFGGVLGNIKKTTATLDLKEDNYVVVMPDNKDNRVISGKFLGYGKFGSSEETLVILDVELKQEVHIPIKKIVLFSKGMKTEKELLHYVELGFRNKLLRNGSVYLTYLGLLSILLKEYSPIDSGEKKEIINGIFSALQKVPIKISRSSILKLSLILLEMDPYDRGTFICFLFNLFYVIETERKESIDLLSHFENAYKQEIFRFRKQGPWKHSGGPHLLPVLSFGYQGKDLGRILTLFKEKFPWLYTLLNDQLDLIQYCKIDKGGSLEISIKSYLDTEFRQKKKI